MALVRDRRGAVASSITALIGRLIIAVVVIVLARTGLAAAHVTSRTSINEHKCDLNATFFGIHVDAPATSVQPGLQLNA